MIVGGTFSEMGANSRLHCLIWFGKCFGSLIRFEINDRLKGASDCVAGIHRANPRGLSISSQFIDGINHLDRRQRSP